MVGEAKVRIAVGADHGGFCMKESLKSQLKAHGHRVLDMGTFSPESCDYPKVGARVGEQVSSGKAQRGLLLCKSGAGMAIVANKFPRVRAAVCQTAAAARHAREHNDANVLVLGASGLTLQKARGIVKAWMETPFGGGRHARRVRQIGQIERSLYSHRTS